MSGWVLFTALRGLFALFPNQCIIDRNMLVILYRFVAKEGCQDEFERTWAIVTDAIKRTRSSLGSKLHRTEEALTYIAYAQWPSAEVYDGGIGTDLFTEDEKAALASMKESTTKIETVHRMTVVDDRLVK